MMAYLQKIEIEYEDVIMKKHMYVMAKTVFMMAIKDDSNGRNDNVVVPCISNAISLMIFLNLTPIVHKWI